MSGPVGRFYCSRLAGSTRKARRMDEPMTKDEAERLYPRRERVLDTIGVLAFLVVLGVFLVIPFANADMTPQRILIEFWYIYLTGTLVLVAMMLVLARPPR